MLDKFSWLHLSDFHFKAQGDVFGQDITTQAIVRDTSTRISKDYPLAFVLVTGDIAFSGKSAEYKRAIQFFYALASKLDISLDRIFVVPGNHDVDRDLRTYLHDGVRQKLTNQQEVDNFLGGQGERADLMDRQAAFASFRTSLGTDSTVQTTQDGLAYVTLLDLQGFRISILGLNSAWLSGQDDQPGNLLIGDRQIINALTLSEENHPQLTIALAHHPIDWLADFDRLSCNGRLFPSLNFLHTGHVHHQGMSAVLQPSSECLLLAAGSAHASRHYENSYNLVEFDVGAAQCSVRHFNYRPDSGRFEEAIPITRRISLGGEIAESPTEIAQTIRETVPAASPYAEYFASLLLGEMNEVPVELTPRKIIFASRSFFADVQFDEVRQFLRLENTLRVYHHLPLVERLALHRSEISEFTALLARIEGENSEFGEALANRVSQAGRLVHRDEQASLPYQVQYLDDLARSEEWTELVEAARRLLTSSSEEVQMTAHRHLALALMRSDDPSQQDDGYNLAKENLAKPWAGVSDYIAAANGAESVIGPDYAVQIILEALDRWPDNTGLRDYGRSLATHAGSHTLRQRLTETE